jgi:hypothetical protein
VSWWWGPVEELTPVDLTAMADLLAEYFDGAERSVFDADLANKTHVVLVRNSSGRLVGFTTLALVPAAGELPWTIYSGDTIVAPEGRANAELARGWIEAALSLADRHRIERLVWLLVCSSVRTYRFLPVFFTTFSPHPTRPTPPEVRAEMQRLAQARYGGELDPASGVVTLAHPQIVKPTRSAPSTDDLEAFFHRANPGADRGDELVCHCEIRLDNLTAAGRRMLSATRRIAG